jgi:transcriptional regulator with XRE-family HTH domain
VGQASTKEVRVTEPRKLRKWSHAAFSTAWLDAKRANPKLRTMDLATAAGVTPTTLYNWRRGSGRPDLDQALALAATLGCDVYAFIR